MGEGRRNEVIGLKLPVSLCLFPFIPKREPDVHVSWAGYRAKRTPASLLHPLILAPPLVTVSVHDVTVPCFPSRQKEEQPPWKESPSEPGSSCPGPHSNWGGCCHRLLAEQRAVTAPSSLGSVRQTSCTLSGNNNAAISLLENQCRSSCDRCLALVWFA